MWTIRPWKKWFEIFLLLMLYTSQLHTHWKGLLIIFCGNNRVAYFTKSPRFTCFPRMIMFLSNRKLASEWRWTTSGRQVATTRPSLSPSRSSRAGRSYYQVHGFFFFIVPTCHWYIWWCFFLMLSCLWCCPLSAPPLSYAEPLKAMIYDPWV